MAAPLLGHSSPARAQAGAAISIFSDDRFRGYSISDGNPVGILDLTYDAASGLYGAVSGSVAAAHGGRLQPISLVVNGGYAKRLRSGLSVDVGAVHTIYSGYSTRGTPRSYNEVYAGISGKSLSARIYASPDYLKRSGSFYGELDGNVPITGKLRFSGHIGLLVPLHSDAHSADYGREIDWRVGIVRQLGRVSAQASWTAIRPGHDLNPNHSRSRSALVAGLTYAF